MEKLFQMPFLILELEQLRFIKKAQHISSLKTIIDLIKSNNVIGITPDGPKGPSQELKEGLVSVLKKKNVVIIPLSYSAKFKIKLNTRFLLLLRLTNLLLFGEIH